MISFREHVGDEYYIWGRKEFDNSRHYLKNCGKPKDWYDIFLIKFHRETCNLFKRFC